MTSSDPRAAAAGVARRRTKLSPWPFVGMGGLACVLFLDAASSVFAPWWVVAPLIVVWLALFVLACRWFTPHPRRVLWAAVAGVAVWFVVTVVGGIAFDW